jgi:large subunit ribosomal protein L25
MEQIDLNAEVRTTSGKQVRQIRVKGYVPAVIYGSHYAATPIQIDAKTLQKTLARAAGNTLIRLQITGREPVAVLAREVQRDTLKHFITHVDFQQVVMTEKISADVPLKLVGDAPAVRALGGILVHGIDRLEVNCLPGDLPSTIEVDISSLAAIHDAITVANLNLPAAVTILAEPGTVIARIEAPRIVEVEEVAAAPEAPTEAEPELVGKRLEREEEAEKS